MVFYNTVRIRGNLPGGEVWSVNPTYGPSVTTPEQGLVESYADLQEWAESIAALNTNAIVPGALRALMSTAGSITSIRTEYRSDSELLQAGEYVLTQPAVGTGAPNKTYQTALVSSILTGRPGRSYRGRLYWPALAIALNPATMRVQETDLEAITEAVEDLLSGIAAVSPDGTAVALAVVSLTRSLVTPATAISCGDVLDVQRRRRDTLTEARYTVPVVAT